MDFQTIIHIQGQIHQGRVPLNCKMMIADILVALPELQGASMEILAGLYFAGSHISWAEIVHSVKNAGVAVPEEF